MELTRPVGSLQLVATIDQEDGLLLGNPQVLDDHDHDHDDDHHDVDHPLLMYEVPFFRQLASLQSPSQS